MKNILAFLVQVSYKTVSQKKKRVILENIFSSITIQNKLKLKLKLKLGIGHCGIGHCGPRERGRKLEHRASVVENWSTAPRGPARRERGGCFCTNFSSFSIQYLRVLSAVLARWKIWALRATDPGSFVKSILQFLLVKSFFIRNLGLGLALEFLKVFPSSPQLCPFFGNFCVSSKKISQYFEFVYMLFL